MQERRELGGSKRKTERAGNVLIRHPCQKTEEEERENKEKEKIEYLEWTDRKKALQSPTSDSASIFLSIHRFLNYVDT